MVATNYSCLNNNVGPTVVWCLPLVLQRCELPQQPVLVALDRVHLVQEPGGERLADETGYLEGHQLAAVQAIRLLGTKTSNQITKQNEAHIVH